MQVTIIGGGSYQWTPELMADLFGTESLRGMHLVLEDIDPDPLPKMEALANKVSAAMDAKATVATTTDQRRALDGADFVIVTISTGGFESMAFDLDVPARYGIRQSVGDTVGPGGINRALRNIPVMAGIARDVESVCPDAWFLNITNPMTVLTRTVTEVSRCKVVGLCHEVGNWCWDVALMLGVAHDAVRPTVSGVNHLPIVTSVDIDGKDGMAILRDLIDEVGGLEALAPSPDQEEAPQFSKLDFARRHRLQLTFLDRWGAIPAANDRHIAEFVPWILTEESGWGADYGIELTSIERRQGHQDGYIADVDAWLAGSKDLQTWPSGELPAPIIDSLLTGTPREVPVNIPNAGQCPDVPLGSVVESICVVDADGVRGRDQAALPAPFAELFRRHVATQEMVVRAALDGDRSLAQSAFLLDPLAGRGPLRSTEEMIDELMVSTARWLPQFEPIAV
jgi:alpha-galactosidase/6-phospho-beta-glucosidase family protein